MKRKPLFYGLIIAVFLFLLANSINNAAQFTVNTHRFDPYKQFKFRVKWDGKYVAGISKISGLYRNTKVVLMREGGDVSTVRKSPGQTVYEPILLERGLTHDTEFEQWANKVWTLGSGSGSETSLKDFRKDIIIDLFNEAGQKVLSYKVYRCWPSRYSAINELDANNTDVAIESIVLEHEGWERDQAVVEPAEPSFD
jgi:phage tail-like protein